MQAPVARSELKDSSKNTYLKMGCIGSNIVPKRLTTRGGILDKSSMHTMNPTVHVKGSEKAKKVPKGCQVRVVIKYPLQILPLAKG